MDKNSNLKKYPNLEAMLDNNGPAVIMKIIKKTKSGPGKVIGNILGTAAMLAMLLTSLPSVDKTNSVASAATITTIRGEARLSDVWNIDEFYARRGNGGKTSMATKTSEEISYNDVPASHWAYNSIMKAAYNNILAMYSNTEKEFYPEEMTDRGAFATMLVKSLDTNVELAVNNFTDIASSKYLILDTYISYAVSQGLVSGVGNNQFGPELKVSRQDAAVMLARALDVRYNGSIPMTNHEFVDQDQIAPYAVDAVQLVASAGLMSGYTDGTFQPNGTISNAETATILVKLAEKLKGQEIDMPKGNVTGEPTQYGEWYSVSTYKRLPVDGIIRECISSGPCYVKMSTGEICEVIISTYLERQPLLVNQKATSTVKPNLVKTLTYPNSSTIDLSGFTISSEN